MTTKKRKICYIITSPIHFSRGILLLSELSRREDVELQIVVGASAMLDKYGDVIKLMQEHQLVPAAQITMTIEGGNPVAMAKTAGLGIIEFSTAFQNLKPDIVLLRADRFEVLAAAIAAAYMNITVAHIEGGDVTGSIDESVRHAITKLSHIHFPTNSKAHERILQMGERPDTVYNFGSLDVEFVEKSTFDLTNTYVNSIGVGDVVDIQKPFLLVMQHPVTSEVGKNRAHIDATLHAVQRTGLPTVWFWPNVDAGTDEVSRGIRSFREHHHSTHMRFIKYLPPNEFMGLMKAAACLVGNSSAGIKEASFLGTPVVNIGSRQNGRPRGPHIRDVVHDADAIYCAINVQVQHGKYEQNSFYYQPDTSSRMAEALVSTPLYVQKQFNDPPTS
ncbi:MAG: UDP-N-acetylglucosamine 2-epimerase [Patescibacteria group bacterium]